MAERQLGKAVFCPQTGKTYPTIKDAAEDLGISPTKAGNLYRGYIVYLDEKPELIPKDPFDAKRREEAIKRRKQMFEEEIKKQEEEKQEAGKKRMQWRLDFEKVLADYNFQMPDVSGKSMMQKLQDLESVEEFGEHCSNIIKYAAKKASMSRNAPEEAAAYAEKDTDTVLALAQNNFAYLLLSLQVKQHLEQDRIREGLVKDWDSFISALNKAAKLPDISIVDTMVLESETERTKRVLSPDGKNEFDALNWWIMRRFGCSNWAELYKTNQISYFCQVQKEELQHLFGPGKTLKSTHIIIAQTDLPSLEELRTKAQIGLDFIKQNLDQWVSGKWWYYARQEYVKHMSLVFVDATTQDFAKYVAENFIIKEVTQL